MIGLAIDPSCNGLLAAARNRRQVRHGSSSSEEPLTREEIKSASIELIRSVTPENSPPGSPTEVNLNSASVFEAEAKVAAEAAAAEAEEEAAEAAARVKEAEV